MWLNLRNRSFVLGIFLGKDVLAHKRSFPQVSSLIIFDLLGKMHSAKIPFFVFFWLSAGDGSAFPECANEAGVWSALRSTSSQL